MYKIDPTCAEFKRILDDYWYYSVELLPGLFTRSDEHPNIICTRELLSRLDPTGSDVCDIGTMEGMIPVLLKRRGAKSVVAVDALNFSEKVQLVQRCYGQSFEYYPRTSLSRCKELLGDRARLSGFLGQDDTRRGFDIVVLSGVLYHVFSPFQVIGLARTILRAGGLLILETAASTENQYSQNWVFRGDRWIYPNGTNTWFLTLKLLDHFLRFARFKPIDCVHGMGWQDITRVAVAALAVSEPLPLRAESEWFVKTTQNFDYDEIIDLNWATGPAHRVPYSPQRGSTQKEIPGAIDIHQTVTSTRPLQHDRNKIIFRLADTT
jgi:2-polyprenyl-3-methyl-5-hydroxy-6-metoxy-1,4-benzoquinol methylase